MKNNYFILCVILFFCFIACKQTTVQLSDDTIKTGTVVGKILLDESETKSYGFIVSIPGTSYSAVTDIDGSFSISEIPAGKRNGLVIQKGNYSYYWEKEFMVPQGDTVNVGTKNFVLEEVRKFNDDIFEYIGEFGDESIIKNPVPLTIYHNFITDSDYMYTNKAWKVIGEEKSTGLKWRGFAVIKEDVETPASNDVYYDTNLKGYFIFSNDTWNLYREDLAENKIVRIDIWPKYYNPSESFCNYGFAIPGDNFSFSLPQEKENYALKWDIKIPEVVPPVSTKYTYEYVSAKEKKDLIFKLTEYWLPKSVSDYTNMRPDYIFHYLEDGSSTLYYDNYPDIVYDTIKREDYDTEIKEIMRIWPLLWPSDFYQKRDWYSFIDFMIKDIKLSSKNWPITNCFGFDCLPYAPVIVQNIEYRYLYDREFLEYACQNTEVTFTIEAYGGMTMTVETSVYSKLNEGKYSSLVSFKGGTYIIEYDNNLLSGYYIQDVKGICMGLTQTYDENGFVTYADNCFRYKNSLGEEEYYNIGHPVFVYEMKDGSTKVEYPEFPDRKYIDSIEYLVDPK